MKLQDYQVIGKLHITNKDIMPIKEIVCESCEASNAELTDEFTREVEELNDDDPYDI